MTALTERGRGVLVRAAATPAEIAGAGEVTAAAYLSDGLLTAEHPYTRELRDAARRAAEATLLVALGPGGPGSAEPSVVGTLTLARRESPWAEFAEPGEVELRMLAVAPGARGRGVGEALMRSALGEAVALGAHRVVLSTLDSMRTAHRLYGRLGFVAAPARDRHDHGIDMRVLEWAAPPAPGVAVEAATWPPLEVVDVDGWRLGISGGFTRRANSVLPLAEPGDVADALARVERCYGERGLPTVFRVGRESRPDGLRDLLLARGYAPAAVTDVLVLDGLTAEGTGSGVTVGQASGLLPGVAGDMALDIADAPDEAWLACWTGVKAGAGADLDLARAVVTGSRAAYLSARDATGVVGVIRAAFADDWTGLSCLTVVPAARRRGLGRALTRAALDVAARSGARRSFLQVEAGNVGAAALYAQMGFQPADRYCYVER
ncbi:GNAT family N-acetyltransferase [Cellulomonas cellasea]|uniref:GNAT family N-acetyltransferase n=1 Tax=Cellulomonas cellasea TaxID=43670 RepID=UPI0025A33E23|nr:GNAT family N-acetyltransferase [Cellulomonas cellasea]MDM8085022.1 GNAT family N-acetyltransferase [Cellulomonas cellasea]